MIISYVDDVISILGDAIHTQSYVLTSYHNSSHGHTVMNITSFIPTPELREGGKERRRGGRRGMGGDGICTEIIWGAEHGIE